MLLLLIWQNLQGVSKPVGAPGYGDDKKKKKRNERFRQIAEEEQREYREALKPAAAVRSRPVAALLYDEDDELFLFLMT